MANTSLMARVQGNIRRLPSANQAAVGAWGNRRLVGAYADPVEAMLGDDGYMIGAPPVHYEIGSAYGADRFHAGAPWDWPRSRRPAPPQRRGYPRGFDPRRHGGFWPQFANRQYMGDPRMVGYTEIGSDDTDMADDGGAEHAAYADALARSQTLVREKEPTKSRQYAVGFDSGDVTDTPIASGDTVAIQVQPQVLFRPERLVIPDTVANTPFLIQDFKVGKNSQFGSQASIPAGCFVPGSFGVRLKCDTAQVSQQLTVNANNIGGADARFFAGLFGEAVE